jgi:hypothetical protein
MLKNTFRCPIKLYSDNETGDKHCHKCAKNVIDLRALSDAEIDRIGAENGEFCGIIQSKRLAPNYNKLALFALAFLLASGAILLPVEVKAQDSLTKADSVVVNQNSYWIEGTITDKENGESLPFVNVVIMQNGKQITGGTTNFDGEFKIEVAKSLLDTNDHSLELKISNVGYQKKEKIVELNDDNIEIQMDVSLDRGVIIGAMQYIHSEPMDPPGVTTFKRNEIRNMPGGYPQ